MSIYWKEKYRNEPKLSRFSETAKAYICSETKSAVYNNCSRAATVEVLQESCKELANQDKLYDLVNQSLFGAAAGNWADDSG